MSSPLYTTEILRLAMGAAMHPRLTAPGVSAEARTPVCGSRIAIDLALDGDGRVSAVGLDVHACAMGQASAGLFAASAVGYDAAGLAVAHETLAAWLSGASDNAPEWPGIAALAPARAYPARHAAILLPYDAALSALAQRSVAA